MSLVRPLPALLALTLSLLAAGCASTLPSSPVADGSIPAHAPATAATPAARAGAQDGNGALPARGAAKLTPITVDTATSAPVVTLSPPADIWERIRRGFAMPDLESDLVRDREQWYASRPDYIQRMTERSERYLFHIVEEIERRGMPMELALLPFIESAFNPQAVSSARAAGMWQFMPATGQSFDLKQNVFRDDRRDVLASTRAALDYLQQLHDRFGDWHLALAAYNWGQGNVNRAVTRNQKAGLPTSYTDLSMPLETQYYVPKLQAIKNIVAHPEAFATELPNIGNRPFFDTVAIDRDMDVALIASLSGISEKDFRALNPSIKQPVVMAAGTPEILLPWDSAVDFQRRLDAHQGPMASWTAWVVPKTMTAAQAANQAGMSEAELRKVNRIPPRMLVRAGSSLLVPRGEQRDADVPVHVADNAQLSLQPEIILKRTSVRARKGENLARLAKRYGLSPSSVASWNKLSVQARLKPGQRVTVMLPERVALAQSASERQQGSAKTQAQAGKGPSSKVVAKSGKAGKSTKVSKTAKTTAAAKTAKAGKASEKVASKTSDKKRVPAKKKVDVKLALDSKGNKKR